jgi:hypothetical protein
VSALQGIHVLHGEWAGDIVMQGAPGEQCDDPSGILAEGNGVVLNDASGSELSQTSLRAGFVNNEGFCSYGFTLWGIPQMPTYSIDIQLSRGVRANPIQLSLEFLESNNWKLDFTVASSEIVQAAGEAQRASSANEPAATEAPVSPTQDAQEAVVTPKGKTLTANGWEITVIDAYTLPDPPGSSVAYNIVVTLNVRNTMPTPRHFGKPDMDFAIISEQGWGGRHDIFKSSSTSVTLEEWNGLYSQGFDYQHSTVYAVQKWDPNLYQSGLSRWVLTITDGDTQYRFEIGDLPAT